MSEFSQSLAVVIGINQYSSGIAPLQTAVNDAQQLARILGQDHQYRVVQLVDQQATLKALQHLLDELLPKDTQPDGRLLFYFAGHGIALNGDEGPEGYLIPQDAKLGDTNTYLSMPKLQAALSKLPCRHFLGILDCCFAGAFRWSSTRDLLSVPEVIHKERYDRFTQDPAWQVITSAAYDQKALDSLAINSERGQTGNHSPFAAALIDALVGKADVYPPAENGKPGGDGVITATELYLYLRDRVEPATEGNRQRQTPGIWPLKKHDKGEYIFLTPGHELNLPPAPPLDSSKNPYRGLQSFDEKHSDLFFGRKVLVEKLHKFVQTNPLTVVLGTSGSGKSSLVKAGLIPELRKTMGKKWCIVLPLRLGKSPFLALNQALASVENLQLERQNSKSLANSISDWSSRNSNVYLLLFIDQSEELITLCQDEGERKEFVSQLIEAIAVHPQHLRVVLALRSDFEPQLRDYAHIEDWQTARFIVPAMTRAELREVIEKPAEARVMFFQPHELIDQLIDEEADMPGALPLLSFTLSELYVKYLKRQEAARTLNITIERAITKADYDELGGVIQSLTQRADSEYELLTKESSTYSQIIRHVMLRMVAVSGGEFVRRQVPLPELEYPPGKNELVQQVVRRFSQARLLIEGQDAEGKPYVEPAHDALVHGWSKLRDWAKEEEQNLILQRRLTPAAFEWKRRQQAGFLWHGNAHLNELKQVSKSKDNWFNQIEAEFVQRSIKQQHRNQSIYGGIAIGVVLLSVTLPILWRESQIRQISNLIQTSDEQLASNKDLDALISSIQAGKSLKQPLLQVFPSDKLRNQVLQTLRRAFYVGKESNRLQQDPEASLVLDSDGKQLPIDPRLQEFIKQEQVYEFVSPDSNQIVTGEERIIRVWSLQYQLLQQLKLNASWKLLPSLQFSPDGNQLAIVVVNEHENYHTTALLWDWKSNQKEQFQWSKDEVVGVGFQFDGTPLVATGTNNRQDTILWDWSGNRLASLKRNVFGGSSFGVIFNPSGKQALIATGEDSCTPYWWNWSTAQENSEPEPITRADGNNEKYEGFGCEGSFSRDGKKLAIGGRDGMIRVWQVSDEGLLDNKKEFEGHEGNVNKVTFSSDGKQLTSIGVDGAIRIWNLEGRDLENFPSYLATLERHQGQITTLDFNPDGKQIITAGDDDTARLWNLSDQSLASSFSTSQGGVIEILFSPDGKQFATAGKDRTIQLWDLSGEPQLTEPFKLPKGEFGGMVFDPKDRKLLVMIKEKSDGEISSKTYVWDLSADKLLRTFDTRPVKGFLLSLEGQVLVASVAGNSEGELAVVGRLFLWDLASGNLSTTLDECSDGKVKFSASGSLLALAKDDGTVKLCDVQSRHQLVEFKAYSDINEGRDYIVESDRPSIKSISFSRDGSLIATVGADGTVKFWQVGGLGELLKWGCDHVSGYLNNNPNVSESDRHLCYGIDKPKRH